MKIDGVEFDSFGDTDPKKMPLHFFFLAKNIDCSTAQRADTSKQNFSVCPRHWYIDAVINCCDCLEDFIFSAAEQRYWYEDRNFYVDSFPRRCAPCRRLDRTRLELRQRYDAMIETALGRRCSLDAKKHAIALIDELEAAEGEIPEKIKQNRAILHAQLAKAR